jgi:hypothetical protein
MAKKKEQEGEVQESENLEGQLVKVKIPIVKDGMVEDWEVKEVSAELAKQQLDKPKEKRNAHWRLVQYADSKEDKE